MTAVSGAPLTGHAQELALALLISDLSGYTALTEAHGALEASEIVLRFVAPVPVFELLRTEEKRAPAAIDPVCRMQIDVSRAVGSMARAGRIHYFCSLECQRAFANAPYLYDGETGA